MYGIPENILVIFRYGQNENIDAQVNQQENHEECPRERHDEFLGQRGKS